MSHSKVWVDSSNQHFSARTWPTVVLPSSFPASSFTLIFPAHALITDLLVSSRHARTFSNPMGWRLKDVPGASRSELSLKSGVAQIKPLHTFFPPPKWRHLADGMLLLVVIAHLTRGPGIDVCPPE